MKASSVTRRVLTSLDIRYWASWRTPWRLRLYVLIVPLVALGLASELAPVGGGDATAGAMRVTSPSAAQRFGLCAGERLPAKARRVIVARQSPFSAGQITRCRRIARNSALDTEDELK